MCYLEPSEASSEESSINVLLWYFISDNASQTFIRLLGVTVRPCIHVSCPIQQVDGVFPQHRRLIPPEDSWVTSPRALIEDTHEAVFLGVSRSNKMLTITLKTLQQQTFKVQVDEELTVSVRVCTRVNTPASGRDALGDAAASGGLPRVEQSLSLYNFTL